MACIHAAVVEILGQSTSTDPDACLQSESASLYVQDFADPSGQKLVRDITTMRDLHANVKHVCSGQNS